MSLTSDTSNCKFINAAYDKAAEENERCALRLREPDGTGWVMVQIAGLIARRIVCRAEPGDSLARGERCGMIRFGSRVDLYLPEGYTASCTVGQNVFAGQTVIARKVDVATRENATLPETDAVAGEES